jgi:heme/copper-type cytochrome/quinol oxidase subunit 1
MIAFTTLIIAVPTVFILYHLIIKKIRKPVFSYFVIIVVSAVFFILGSVHFIYIGLEILLIGVILVFIKSKFLRKA